MTSVETYPTLAEAARALSGAAYLGGGTVVMRDVNAGTAPGRIVRTSDPAMGDIRVQGDRITLGAGVTMAAILARADLAFLHPVARVIGGPQVRQMGTVGGNLFAPHPYGDFAVALIALGAQAQVVGQGGRAVEELVRDKVRAPLVASLEFNRPRDRTFGFAKVSRVKPKGVSVMSIAVLAPRDGVRFRGVRVAFGAMGPHPMRGSGAERALEGQTADAATYTAAATQAAEGLDAPTDALATTWYRREVAGVHLRRLMEQMERGQ